MKALAKMIFAGGNTLGGFTLTPGLLNLLNAMLGTKLLSGYLNGITIQGAMTGLVLSTIGIVSLAVAALVGKKFGISWATVYGAK